MNQIQRHAPSSMTVSEFVDWDPVDAPGTRWQLIDGEPVAMVPASETHAAIQAELTALIRNHLRASGSPCRVLVTPGIIPNVSAAKNFRIPDIGVTCVPPSRDLAVADPTLLIEILSPGNREQTRANVWPYTTIPSVQEIVIVQSTRIGAEILRTGPDGWPAEPVIVAKGEVFTLASIAFSVVVDDIYATTALA